MAPVFNYIGLLRKIMWFRPTTYSHKVRHTVELVSPISVNPPFYKPYKFEHRRFPSI